MATQADKQNNRPNGRCTERWPISLKTFSVQKPYGTKSAADKGKKSIAVQSAESRKTERTWSIKWLEARVLAALVLAEGTEFLVNINRNSGFGISYRDSGFWYKAVFGFSRFLRHAHPLKEWGHENCGWLLRIFVQYLWYHPLKRGAVRAIKAVTVKAVQAVELVKAAVDIVEKLCELDIMNKLCELWISWICYASCGYRE